MTRIRSLIRNAAAVALVVFAIAGCSRQQVLYGQLSERQANEMVAMLQSAGVPAAKEAQTSGTYSIATSNDTFSRAIELLHANGFPRGSFDSVGQVFKKEGFISSPTEERARLTYAMSQEIANTLQTIDGVVVARVHLAIPEKDPLIDKPKPASASVFIKHRPGRDLSADVNQIKALVVNGIEGLPYDNVTVALFPAEPGPVMHQAQQAPQLGGALAIAALVGGLALAAGGGLYLWRRRQPPPVSSNLTLVKRGEDAKRA
jgi:type III secretion protein J